MKMYCCARGTFHCQYTNGVHFEKLRTKYSIDENILVYYTIQERVHTSTRDWIGIFPRGWTNLQQYLTFEYVTVSPKNLSNLSNRNITFLHTFHREALPNVDYQFVYVSKEIEILGTSSYFRFIVTPNVRPLDLSSNTPDYDIVNDNHIPTILSPTIGNTGKIIGCSRSTDNIVQSYRTRRSFGDQRQKMERTCRFCSKSASFTTNRVQFLVLHNEQLVSRVNRLTRDLELTEATVKSERMAQTVLTKKLQAYEMFIADMFKCLNIMGTVKIMDKSGKEMIVQKIKPKDLPLMRDEAGDKPLPILEVSMLNQSSEMKEYNNEATIKVERVENIPQLPHMFKIEDNKEVMIKNWKKDIEFSVKKEFTAVKEEKKFDISLSVEEQQPQFDTNISIEATGIKEEDHENRRGSYITKEATGTTNEPEDDTCKATCKIEQFNCAEDKLDDTKNTIYDEKNIRQNMDSLISVDSLKCCCDCHLNTSKTLSINKKIDNDNVKEWALQCECDLEISDEMYQMIDNYAERRHSSSIDVTKNGLSAILIKGRNAKFGVIK
ncbi:tax1-binding protein 1 homolog [Apis cerana]|uniref:tax1-binding protein 1 homolog n=1 Tax=Apis cerana TaxID=7461 RepID=UPI00109B7486|nr:tax1-binding protein 1 homolog [Apis cerana]